MANNLSLNITQRLFCKESENSEWTISITFRCVRRGDRRTSSAARSTTGTWCPSSVSWPSRSTWSPTGRRSAATVPRENEGASCSDRLPQCSLSKDNSRQFGINLTKLCLTKQVPFSFTNKIIPNYTRGHLYNWTQLEFTSNFNEIFIMCALCGVNLLALKLSLEASKLLIKYRWNWPPVVIHRVTSFIL